MTFFIIVFVFIVGYSIGANNAEAKMQKRINDLENQAKVYKEAYLHKNDASHKTKTPTKKKSSKGKDYYGTSSVAKLYKSEIQYYEDEKHIDKEYLYPQKNITGHLLSGKKIIFTGDFNNLSRNEMAKMAWEVGADVDVSVTSRINFVVMGENFGESKMDKIEELNSEGAGITIMDEEKFLSLF